MKFFLFLMGIFLIPATLLPIDTASVIKEELIEAIHNADVQHVEYLIPAYLSLSEKEKDLAEMNSIVEQLIFESSDEPHFLTVENGVKAVVAVAAATGAAYNSYLAYEFLKTNTNRPLAYKLACEGTMFAFSALLVAFGIEKAVQIGTHSAHYQRHANLLAIKEILRRIA
jgi:hypothetical protein